MLLRPLLAALLLGSLAAPSQESRPPKDTATTATAKKVLLRRLDDKRFRNCHCLEVFSKIPLKTEALRELVLKSSFYDARNAKYSALTWNELTGHPSKMTLRQVCQPTAHEITIAATLFGRQWDNPVVLCEAYFKQTRAEQFSTLLHEMLHSYGLVYRIYDLMYHVNMRRQYFGLPGGAEDPSHDISLYLWRDCHAPIPGSAETHDALLPLSAGPGFLTADDALSWNQSYLTTTH